MDVNTLRIVATVCCFLTFVGIVAWALSRKRDSEFSRAANLPFEQD